MDRSLGLIVSFVVIASIGGGAYLVVNSKSDENAMVTHSTTGVTTDVKTGQDALVAVDACDVLTEAIAKQIIGETAIKGDTSAGNASTDSVSVSNCVYTAKIDPNAVKPNNTKGVSILARSGKTNEGADSNKSQFGAGKPDSVQDVSGLGDKAYFNPQFGQLNVLKGGNWYIIIGYNGLPTNATLETDKKLANLLKLK